MLRLIHRAKAGLFVILATLLVAPAALADTVVSAPPALTLGSKQTWALLIGTLVPLVTYVINRVGPWASEPVKAFVAVLASAVSGGLYTALATTSFGWNSATLQMVLTAVAASLAAHHMLWKPSGVSAHLGAGTNSRYRLHWTAVPEAVVVEPAAKPASATPPPPAA